MQEAVRAINGDTTLSREEKSKRIQELFKQASNTVVRKQQQQKETSSANKPCAHYERHCDIETPCCEKWYPCRICHDEAESEHTLNRGSTKLMKCRLCGLIQPVSSCCAGKDCEWKSTRYYCERCRLWEDNPKKDIFHCEGCGICRIGKREQYFHCDQCKLCLPIGIQNSHHCVKDAADDVCVCGEYMQTSTKELCHLQCGHTIHCHCRTKLLRTGNIACPKCRKSIVRDPEWERRLTREIRLNRMPPEYRRKCQILCNDCGTKTVAKFHFLGISCKPCGSYNTTIIETLAPDDDDDVDEEEEEQHDDDDQQADGDEEMDAEEVEMDDSEAELSDDHQGNNASDEESDRAEGDDDLHFD